MKVKKILNEEGNTDKYFVLAVQMRNFVWLSVTARNGIP